MDPELKKELYFLVAKFLDEDFPDICKDFIRRCEANNKFPGSIFCKNPSFSTLCESVVPGIPTDQLLRLVKMACPRSDNTSILFNTERKKRTPIARCDNTLHQLQAAPSPFSGFVEAIRIWGHTDKTYCLAIDSTSQLLITGSDDYRVKLWFLGDDVRLIDSLQGYQNWITDINIHPMNTMFAVSCIDGTISIYSMETGDQMCKLEFDNSAPGLEDTMNSVHTVRFSPDGEIMAAALEEGSVRLFSVPSFDEIFAFALPSKQPADWMSFSGGGAFLAITADPSDVIILELKGLEYIRLEGHTELPDYVSFGKIDCTKMITCSYQETCVKLWSCGEKCWDSHVNLTLSHNINNVSKKVKVVKVSFNSNDSLVVAISTRCIFAWSTTTHELVSVCTHEMFTDHCSALAVHPFLPEVVFVGCQNGQAAIWDIVRREVITAFQMDETSNWPICEAVWSPDGQSIVASNEKGKLSVFRRSYKNMAVSELFMRKELDEESIDETIVDGQNEPLMPQPPRITCADVNTKIQPRGICATAQKCDDELLLGKWRQMEKQEAIEFRDWDEEEEEEEEEDDLIVLNAIYDRGFRMPTRNLRRFNYSDTTEFSDTYDESDSSDVPRRSDSDSRTPSPRRGRSSEDERSQPRSRKKASESPNLNDTIVISRSGRTIKPRTLSSSSDDEPPRRKPQTKRTRRCVTPPKPRRSSAADPSESSEEERPIISLRNLRSRRAPEPEPEPPVQVTRSGRAVKSRNQDMETPKKQMKRKPSPELHISITGRVVKKRVMSSDDEDRAPAPKKKTQRKVKQTEKEKEKDVEMRSGSGRILRQRKFSSDYSEDEPPRAVKQKEKKNVQTSRKKSVPVVEETEKTTRSGRLIKKREFSD